MVLPTSLKTPTVSLRWRGWRLARNGRRAFDELSKMRVRTLFSFFTLDSITSLSKVSSLLTHLSYQLPQPATSLRIHRIMFASSSLKFIFALFFALCSLIALSSAARTSPHFFTYSLPPHLQFELIGLSSRQLSLLRNSQLVPKRSKRFVPNLNRRNRETRSQTVIRTLKNMPITMLVSLSFAVVSAKKERKLT